MRALRNMLDLFRRPPEPVPPRPLPVKVKPEREEVLEDLHRAKKANDRAALRVAVTSRLATRTENRVQSMMQGVLNETDRSRTSDERH